jgi:hypothetical protein
MSNNIENVSHTSIINCGAERGSFYEGKICLPEILDRIRNCFENDDERDVFWKYLLRAARQSTNPLTVFQAREIAEYLIHLEMALYRMNAGEISNQGFTGTLDKLKVCVGFLRESFHDPISAPDHLFFNMLAATEPLESTERAFRLERIPDIRTTPVHLQVSDQVPNDILSWLLRDIFGGIRDLEGAKVCFIIPYGTEFDDLYETIRKCPPACGVEVLRVPREIRQPLTEAATLEFTYAG